MVVNCAMRRLRPVSFFKLASKKRSPERNWQLGIVLAFVAGFVNAGGLFLVGRYTSHMTGVISEAADLAAIGNAASALTLLGFAACFIAGSVVTTLLVLTCRRYALHAQFSLPLVIEAALLTLIVGLFVSGHTYLTLVIALLCFLMGIQNALITKASTSVVRTTHVTGMVTDLGIEIGRAIFLRSPKEKRVASTKIILFVFVLMSFLTGGVVGAILIDQGGARGLIPVIILLGLLSAPGIYCDVRSAFRRSSRQRRSGKAI